MKSQAIRTVAGKALFARRGDETSARVNMVDLGLEHPDRQAYVPSAWWILRWLLPRSEVRPTDVFVELGCGKGRIVLDAARRYPFAKVIGVELASELTDVARELVGRERPKLRSGDVRIETADATRFPIPDDMTYAYMFNPFNGPTFDKVVGNIVASLDRAPRPLRVIYVMPVDHEALMATGRFRLLRRVRTTRLVSPVEAAVYEAL